MIVSVLVSSLAGLVMEKHILKFPTLALLVPVLNGLTGNIASIYASRISTFLHISSQKATQNSEQEDTNQTLYIRIKDLNVDQTFTDISHTLEYQEVPQPRRFDSNNKQAFHTLTILSILSSLLFLLVTSLLNLASVNVDLEFVIAYTSVTFILTLFLLYASHKITHWTWKRGMDPDTVSLPFVTAIADVFGTVGIVLALTWLKGLVEHGDQV